MKKTLVVAPSWIGDTVLAQPLLALLAQQDTLIDVIAPSWSAPLLRRMPEVHAVIDNPLGHGDFKLAQRRTLGRQLAREHYDEAVVLPNSWKSALIPWFAGIPKRTGFTGEARWGLLNNRHTLDKQALPQLAQRYARLAQPTGSDALPALPATRLNSSPVQQQATRTALGLAINTAPVVFCPGAEYGPAKRWPARHFATLARKVATPSAPVWLVGAAKDKAVGDEIAALSEGHAINLCGRTSLEQAIDLLAGAQLVVSNDSGLMHVSAALGRPLIAVYGSSSPTYTPPLSSRAKIISLQLSCSPCFKRECPLGHMNCLEQLDAQHVVDAMKDMPHAA
jgi:heptosyltransferase-2